MRASLKRWGGIFTALTICIAIWALFKNLEYRKFEERLPSAIGITKVNYSGSYPGFPESVVSESCGAAFLALSEETLSKINKKGLRFFDGALLQRVEEPKAVPDLRYAYGSWRPTPMPENWFDNSAESQGLWLGLPCAGIDSDVREKIIGAAKSPGSYFTRSHDEALLVIPSMGLVIYSWWYL